MKHPFDGFYIVYITGKHAQGFALLIFRNGQIIGADPGSFLFDGHYLNEGEKLAIFLKVKAPANVPRVQGGQTGALGEEYELEFQCPQDFASQDFLQINTPYGPVNVKFVKLRGLCG